ncbi:hypothetical protein H8959_001069, partial [Pygathrix nigripes]
MHQVNQKIADIDLRTKPSANSLITLTLEDLLEELTGLHIWNYSELDPERLPQRRINVTQKKTDKGERVFFVCWYESLLPEASPEQEILPPF